MNQQSAVVGKPRDHGRWAEEFPWLGTKPVPTEGCYSEEQFNLEKEKIFKKVWWPGGRIEEIPNKADYKVRPLPFADTSVIIMRGDDGRIRAFHNTCSHRGNSPIDPESWDRHGNARNGYFRCRFHGWVYNSRGELMQVPDEERFFGLDKSEHGLTPIACDVWNGFIFINVDPSPSQTLADYLGDIGKHLSGFPYDEVTHVYRYWTVINANWKICADAFQEAYHAPNIHAGTFPGVFVTGLEHVKLAGAHRTSAVCLDMTNMLETPVSKIAARIRDNSITQARGRRMLPAHINPDDRADFSFEMAFLFPFYGILPSEGFVLTDVFYPIDKDHMLWEATQYTVPPRNFDERFAMEYGHVLQRDAWLEDTQTMEFTHASLRSGAKKYFQFQDEEVLCRHSHHAVRRYLEAKKPFTGYFAWGDINT